MSRWILDTDHASLYLRGNQAVIEQLVRKRPKVVTTIITVQELYNGWASRINKKMQPDDLVVMYRKFAASVGFVKSIQVLNFDERAKEHYVSIRQQGKALATNRLEKDVRIASIALSTGDILVTRNTRDFELVPGLRFESWA